VRDALAGIDPGRFFVDGLLFLDVELAAPVGMVCLVVHR
jgi:hypothetical protein